MSKRGREVSPISSSESEFDDGYINCGSSVTERKYVEGMFKWEIKPYSTIFPDVKCKSERAEEAFRYLELMSNTFTIERAGLKKTTWNLLLSLDKSTPQDWYLSLYLERQIREPNEEPCFVTYSFSLLNNHGEPEMTRQSKGRDFSGTEPSSYGFPKFIRLDKVWESERRLIRDDTLRIHLKFILAGTQVESYITMEGSSGVKGVSGPDLLSQKLVEDLEKWLMTGENSSCKIICGNKEFKVHKEILSARSEVFSRMLSSDMVEGTQGVLNVTDIDVDTMDDLLKYLYTSKMTIEPDDVDRLSALARAANKYGLHALKSHCFGLLYKRIDEDNCGELAVLGYLHSVDPRTQTRIIEYCHKHWTTLVQNQEFQQLLVENPKAFISPRIFQSPPH